TVLELENVDLSIGDRNLVTNLTWRIGPGDRIGLVGVNGSGKTTLLRLLAGETSQDSGNRIHGKTVRLAHLRQELEDLPNDRRVLQTIEDVAGSVTFGKQELSASQLAERLGFPTARQWTPVGELSGGERRRLQLVRLLMSEPNVLLLDEPTNDLDIDTLQQLEDLLDSWAGTLIVVSHDRYLVERICDSVYALFGDGDITHLPGGIDEYLQRRRQVEESAPARSSGGKSAGETSSAQWRAASKRLSKLERRLATLEQRQGQLHDQLAEAATEPERLARLDAELKEVLAEKDEVEQEWLETSELVE